MPLGYLMPVLITCLQRFQGTGWLQAWDLRESALSHITTYSDFLVVSHSSLSLRFLGCKHLMIALTPEVRVKSEGERTYDCSKWQCEGVAIMTTVATHAVLSPKAQEGRTLLTFSVSRYLGREPHTHQPRSKQAKWPYQDSLCPGR